MEDIQVLDKRGQILQASLGLFATVGYFNASIHDIRRAADVSIGSIYHYFTNKETLARALYDDLAAEMVANIRVCIREHATAKERCRAIMDFFFSWTEANPQGMHYIMYARHQEFMPGSRAICSSEPFRLVLDVVAEGMASGEILPLPPVVAAASLFGGALRLIQLFLDQAIEGPIARYFDDAWACGWRAVTAP